MERRDWESTMPSAGAVKGGLRGRPRAEPGLPTKATATDRCGKVEILADLITVTGFFIGHADLDRDLRTAYAR